MRSYRFDLQSQVESVNVLLSKKKENDCGDDTYTNHFFFDEIFKLLINQKMSFTKNRLARNWNLNLQMNKTLY